MHVCMHTHMCVYMCVYMKPRYYYPIDVCVFNIGLISGTIFTLFFGMLVYSRPCLIVNKVETFIALMLCTVPHITK